MSRIDVFNLEIVYTKKVGCISIKDRLVNIKILLK